MQGFALSFVILALVVPALATGNPEEGEVHRLPGELEDVGVTPQGRKEDEAASASILAALRSPLRSPLRSSSIKAHTQKEYHDPGDHVLRPATVQVEVTQLRKKRVKAMEKQPQQILKPNLSTFEQLVSRRKKNGPQCRISRWSKWSACLYPCSKKMHQVRHRLVRQWGPGCEHATLRNVRACRGMAKRCKSVLGPLCPKIDTKMLTTRFLRNLISLQAYARASHGKAVEWAKSYRHSSILAFLVLFGRKTKCSIARRYARVRRVLLHHFRMGAGRMMLNQLHSALVHNKHGSLRTRVVAGRPFFVLDHKRLGILHFIAIFDKVLKVKRMAYFRKLQLIKADNQSVQQVVFSAKTGSCQCNGASISGGGPRRSIQMGYQCQKWTGQDTRPWCIVSRKCKTASRMTNLSYGRHYWTYCDKHKV